MMRRGYGSGWLGVVILGLAGLVCLVGSAAALDLGGIKLTPSIAYKGEYDDNVFRTHDDKKWDYVNILTPSITVEATPGRHDFKAGYKVDILRYSNNANLDTERHTAFFKGIMKFNRLELRAAEEFRRTDDFPSTQLSQRVLRNENTLTGGFDYDMAQVWGVGFDATWDYFNYLNGSQGDLSFLDRDAYTYATNLYYRLSPKTRVFGEYNYVDENYRNPDPNLISRDNTRHRVLVGVRGDFTERFSLTGKVGYEHLNFRDNARKDLDNPVGSLEGVYKPSDRLQVALLMSRTVSSSTIENNAQYASYNSTLALTYSLTPKITLMPRGYFGYDNYSEASINPSKSSLPLEKRYDFLYGAGLGIRYEVLKWLRFDANYDFSRRDSNNNTSDYDDNRVNFSVTLSM